MMRIFLLFATLTWLTLSVSAQNSKALDLARKTIGGNVHLAEGNANKTGTLNPQYYFYVNDERAFALVSADGEKLLGYSKEPSYDAEIGLPPQLEAILNAYSERKLSGGNKSEEIDNKEWLFGDVVEPLIKTEWNQQGPVFDTKTPIINGEHTPTGCVATAFAQILKYFATPEETIAEIPAYTTTTYGIEMPAIPAGQKLQWDLMKDKYPYSGTYTQEEESAIANLMLYVGCMAKMDYTPESSGSSCIIAAEAICKYLGYRGYVLYNVEYSVIRERKMSTIIHYLTKGMPIVAAGDPWDGTSGHAYIIDGIDVDGMLHANWGWGGYLNGYYNDLEMNYTIDLKLISDFIKPGDDESEMMARVIEHFRCAILDSPSSDQWGNEGLVAERNEKGQFPVNASVFFDRLYTPGYNNSIDGAAEIQLTWTRIDGTVKKAGKKYVSLWGYAQWKQLVTFTDEDFDEDGTLTCYLEEITPSGSLYLCRDAQRYPLKLKREGDKVYMVNVSEKKRIELPKPDKTEFVYNRKKQTYTLPENDAYIIVGNTQTNAGVYSVSVRFKEYDTYVWSDGTTGPKEYKFEIKKADPEVKTESYEYPRNRALRDLQLPDNYNWYEPDKILGEKGEYEIYAYYEDLEGNYERVDSIKMNITAIGIFSYPPRDTRTFVYNGKEQTYNVVGAKDYGYIVSGNKQTDAGEYIVTIKLSDPKYDRWHWSGSYDNLSNKDLEYKFVINKAVPKYTVPKGYSLYVDQKLSDITLAENFYWVSPETVMTETGTFEYEAYYEHPDTKNYEKVEGIKIKVTVSEAPQVNKVDIPEADKTEFVYNGKEQTYAVAESEYYTVTGNRQTDAGEYTVTVKLTDTEKNTWSDRTTSDKTFSFIIKKAVPEYTLPEGYSLNVGKKLSDITLPKNFYWVAPETVMTEAGTFEYAAYYELSDTKNYEKVEGIKIKVMVSTVPVVPVEINKVDIPEADKREFVYNGKEQTYAVAESEYYTVAGNKQTDAGEYTVTVKLTDTEKNAWNDGTTSDKTFSFIIKKAVPEYNLPEGYSLNVDQKLSDITLPENFYWVAPETVLTKAGRFEYAAYYEHPDTKNYEKVEGIKIKVQVLSENISFGNIYIPDDIAEWGVKSGETLVLVSEDGVQSNVTYELIIENNAYRFTSATDANGNIVFEGTKNLAPGVYKGEVVITINDSKLGTISKSVAISFMVDYPASYIINPWDDVLAVCNTDKTFTSYQWYKDGQKIENATGQYYKAVGGVNGVYTCLVENEEGVKVFVTPDQYVREATLDIKVTSTDTNTLNVEIEGLTEEELKTAKLYVHTIAGQLAWAATKLEKSNSITLQSGEYVVSVISGTRMASCVVVLK